VLCAAVYWGDRVGLKLRSSVINPATKQVAGLMPGRNGRGRVAKGFADMCRKCRATNTVGISLPI
jgi:hypothetical protein